MKYTILGKTDLNVSQVGFGGIPIIRLETHEAIRVLHRALEKGINFFDTATLYRDSEEKMGRAFESRRQEVILATKTIMRDAEGTNQHLENSLRMLRTDYIDLYQFHQVAQERDWQAIMAPGGAMEAVMKAKEAGKIRYVGVTSHNADMAVQLVKTGLFSTVQFPFNFIETEPADILHPEARKRGMGILAMKPFAGGVIDDAGIAFKFLRQYPDVLPIPGFDSVAAIDEVTAIYQTPNHIAEADLAKMDEYRTRLGKQFCRRCEYCQPCPNGVQITIAMGYPILSSRMAPKVAVDFARHAMESISNCEECDICVERCPYELPISSILKQNADLFRKHCDEVSKRV